MTDKVGTLTDKRLLNMRNKSGDDLVYGRMVESFVRKDFRKRLVDRIDSTLKRLKPHSNSSRLLLSFRYDLIVAEEKADAKG